MAALSNLKASPLCLRTVSTQLRMRTNAFAPSSVRGCPEIFWRSRIIRRDPLRQIVREGNSLLLKTQERFVLVVPEAPVKVSRLGVLLLTISTGFPGFGVRQFSRTGRESSMDSWGKRRFSPRGEVLASIYYKSPISHVEL